MSKLAFFALSLVLPAAAFAQPAPPTPPTPPTPPSPPAGGTTQPPPTDQSTPPPTDATKDQPATTVPAPGDAAANASSGNPTKSPATKEAGDEDGQWDDTGPVNPDKHKKHKKKKGELSGKYIPRKGLELAVDKMKLRLRFAMQPVFRSSYSWCPDGGAPCSAPDATAAWNVRRARAGYDVRLPHHTRLDFELQIKNQVLFIKNAYAETRLGDRVELSAGLIKPPGGLERDASTFDKPFPERSAVANLTHDRELGVKLAGSFDEDEKVQFGVSLAKNRPGNADAEDVSAPPIGIDPDDLTVDPAAWNFQTRVAYVPTDAFEIGYEAGFRNSGDLTLGDTTAEPFDSAVWKPRPYKGVNVHGSIDTAYVIPHAKFMLEGGMWRDGKMANLMYADGTSTLPALVGTHHVAAVGYFDFGYTSGHYGRAIDAGPLLDGWEWVTRIEGLTAKPGEDGDSHFGGFFGVTSGIGYQPQPQLHLQVDAGYQKFTDHVNAYDARQQRLWLELWALVRM
jgi:hypothetical protein